MRYKIPVTSLSIAALLAAGPAWAQTTTDKPTMGQKIEQKADDAASKVKDTAHDAKVGMTDSWVTAKTKIALFADDRVKGRQVSVETQNGMVTLRGKVDSADAKAAAAEIAKRTEHVKGVRNELQVVAPSQRDRVEADDKQIGKNVEQRFKQDPQLKSAKIDAKVDAGVVILTGEVKSIDTSARASEVARSVPGVRYVKNDLTYASRSSLESSRARR
jgi:hyperosmotically inducible protein